MALPPPYDTPDLLTLSSRVPEIVQSAQLKGPTKSDLLMLGQYVQTFNAIELNLRRMLRLFREAGLIGGSRAEKLFSDQLINLARRGVKKMELAEEDLENVLHVLKLTEKVLPYRNLFAHWALYRFPDADAYILITADDRDARQLDDQVPAYDGLHYCVMQKKYMSAFTDRLNFVDGWLSQQVSRWIVDYNDS